MANVIRLQGEGRIEHVRILLATCLEVGEASARVLSVTMHLVPIEDGSIKH